MLADQFHRAADGARSYSQLEEISRLLWRAHGEGQIPDVDATAVAEAVQWAKPERMAHTSCIGPVMKDGLQ